MSLTDDDKQWIAGAIIASENRVVHLVTTITHRLEDRMNERFDDVELRLDTIGSRIENHAASIQTGRRMAVKTEEWKERVDGLLTTQATQLSDLLKRIHKLESEREK